MAFRCNITVRTKWMLSALVAQMCLVLYLQYKYAIFSIRNVRYGRINQDSSHQMHQMDEKFKRNEEWEQLNRITFFRRNAAFYVVNKNLVKLHYLTDFRNATNHKFDVILIVRYQDRLYNITFYFKKSETTKIQLARRVDYESAAIEIKFNIQDEFERRFNLTVKENIAVREHFLINAYVRDTLNDITTEYPLDVRVKQWEKGRKRGAAVCSGIHFGYGNPQESGNFERFKWWLETIKRFGYESISITNHSIPNTAEYIELFKTYQDLIEIRQLKCIPNLITSDGISDDHRHVYFEIFSKIHFRYAAEYNLLKIIDLNDILVSRVCLRSAC